MPLNTDFKASFRATEAIPAARRVKYVAGGGIALASDTEVEIGVSILHQGKTSYAIGEMVGVQLRKLPVLAQAAGDFADGATVKRMASGKVDDAGAGADYATALEAAGAADDIVQVLPL